MSYSSELKNQLILSEVKSKCCAKAELLALLLMNDENSFISADKNFIRRINALFVKSYKNHEGRRLFYKKNKKSNFYWGIDINEVPTADNEKVCCRDAFIRGCFIYSGYVSAPDKPARAEIAFKNKKAFSVCKEQLTQCGIDFNCTLRGGKDIIYIKSITGVSDFLARIGAVGAMLEFENSRIIKNYKNSVNRVTNCDNANLDKTVIAASRQTAVISQFMKTAMFETLPEQLKEIARLRVENESLSLKELGMLLTPVLGKSGVAHRLKKIEDIAKSVK